MSSSRPSDRGEESFATLRELLLREASPEAFEELFDHLEGFEGEALELAIEYAREHLQDWPAACCRVGLEEVWPGFPSGAPRPTAALVRALVEPRLDAGGAQALARTLAFPALEFLDLRGARLQGEAALALVRSPQLQELRSLDLSDNRIGPASAIQLAEAFAPGPLEALDLSVNYLRNIGVAHLAQAPGLQGLRELGLRRCGLNSETSHGSEALSSLAGHLPRLERLALDGNHFSPEGLGLLARASFFGQLEQLELATCGITTEGILALLDATDRLEVLNLKHNQIDPRGIEALAEAPQLAGLKVLALKGNRIGDRGLLALADSPHLGQLETLECSGSEISDIGAQALVDSPHLSRLQHVQLADVQLSDPVSAALRQRFPHTRLYHYC